MSTKSDRSAPTALGLFGMAVAAFVSWQQWHSVGWMIWHGIWGWFYLLFWWLDGCASRPF